MGLTPGVRQIRRVGLFGGAFDPPHDAHVALARAALDELALDRLHVVPTGDAWHKSRPLSPAADRLAMCRLAFAGLPGVVVDDRELRRAGPTYTVDTLTALRADYPGAELFLQIGADQALAFHGWRRARDIIDIATVSIAVRDDPAKAAGQFDPKNPLPGLGLGSTACACSACPRCRTAPPTCARASRRDGPSTTWFPQPSRGILPTTTSTRLPR
jgi:nicotinate-nucleotide adenylyltransferase